MTERKSNTKSKDFYVYLHRKATTGEVFYVGKGTAYRYSSKNGRSEYWKRIVEKYGYTIEFYATGLQEWYAFELEKELIAYYGRDSLTNHTDGGDGTSGCFPSEETRKKLSAAQYGRKHSEKTKEKIRKSHIGIVFSEEHKEKISKAKKIQNSLENNPNAKKIMCVEENIVFDLQKYAVDWLISKGIKANQSNISHCLRLRKHKAYGYTWAYVK